MIGAFVIGMFAGATLVVGFLTWVPERWVAPRPRASIERPKARRVSENTAPYSAEPAMLLWSVLDDAWASDDLPRLYGLAGPLDDPTRPVS